MPLRTWIIAVSICVAQTNVPIDCCSHATSSIGALLQLSIAISVILWISGESTFLRFLGRCFTLMSPIHCMQSQCSHRIEVSSSNPCFIVAIITV